MTDWSQGYVTDVGYTHGYYQELNPLRTQLALLNAGIQPPDISVACELGIGQGVSLNIHAAASEVEWWGTDFNPSHAMFAQDLARASCAKANVRDQPFAEFCADDTLPDFDFICLHGIWSWISDANRSCITDFIARKLKVGGVLLVSYNTQPGWANFAPVRHLMTRFTSSRVGPGYETPAKITSALSFMEEVLSKDPAFFELNPQARTRFADMKGRPLNYLAHEYFNLDWRPTYFGEMDDYLAQAKLSYVTSARLTTGMMGIDLTEDQHKFLETVSYPVLREELQDFMTNQQFRKDYWVKGGKRLTAFEQREALRKLSVVLTVDKEDVELSIKGIRGDVGLKPEVYQPILDALEDHEPIAVGSLEADLGNGNDVNLPQIQQALMVLGEKAVVAVVSDYARSGVVEKQCAGLTTHLMAQSQYDSNVAVLPCPITAGGLTLTRVEQLLALSAGAGADLPNDWAESAWRCLKQQGEKIVKDGKTLESDLENLNELKRAADAFAQRLPLLRRLKVLSKC